jgi:uncharacterized repeat protein (TIGR03837 family)
MRPHMDAERWDIFCHVVDNYGDVAVAWRLARCLARRRSRGEGKRVRLWLDDLTVLSRLRPEITTDRSYQTLEGVEVRRWFAPFPPVEPAAVVVETFGCNPPASYIEAMAAATPRPRWINLEYLSAEAWVESSHKLPSPHPKLPLTKHYFFPGFTERTGGLLREVDLLDRRDRFQRDSGVQSVFWRALGIVPREGALKLSLFGYAGAPYASLLDVIARSPGKVECVVPEGAAATAARAWVGSQTRDRGNLRVHILPFLSQDRYDELLWACDLNFVRGEDSFVRAQWAARPFVWQIYPQDEDAHWLKLGAFLDRYQADFHAPAAAAMRDLWEAWNSGAAMAAAWPAFLARRPAIEAGARDWSARLARLPDLASSLSDFADNVLK